jgi:hypothetical protein
MKNKKTKNKFTSKLKKYSETIFKKSKPILSKIKSYLPKVFKYLGIILIMLIIGVSLGLYYGVKNPPVLNNWAEFAFNLENCDSDEETNFKFLTYIDFSSQFLEENTSSYDEIINELSLNSEKRKTYIPYSKKFIIKNNCDSYNISQECHKTKIYINSLLNNVWVIEEVELKRYDEDNHYKRLERKDNNWDKREYDNKR